MSAGSKFQRDLPNDEYLAAGNANAPSETNPYATMLDLATVGGGDPVGSILTYPSVTPPPGYLFCDGSAFNELLYPILYALLGNSNILPDFRQDFIRGANIQAEIDAFVAKIDSTKLPNNPITGTAANAGAHTHNIPHAAAANNALPFFQPQGYGPLTNLKTQTTGAAGAHTHAITIDGGGDSETAPQHKYMAYHIKAQASTNSGTALTIYEGSGALTAGVTSVIGLPTDVLQFVGATTKMSHTDGAKIILSGVGTTPIGLSSTFGDMNLLTLGKKFDAFSGLFESATEVAWHAQIYDTTPGPEKANLFIGISDFGGTDRPYASVSYKTTIGGSIGFQADVDGERLYSQDVASATALSASALMMFVDGNGYLKGATLTDLGGFSGIYVSDGIITEERTVSGGVGIAINSIHWNLWDTYNILPADSFNVKNPAEEKIFGIDIGAKSISVKGDLTISEAAVASQILNFQDEVNARTGTLTNAPLLTAARTWTLQDGSGTLAFLTDIPAPDGNGIYGGSGTTPSNTNVTVTDSLQFITAGAADRVQIGPVGFTGLNNFHHRSSNGNGAHFDGNSQSASAYAVKIRNFDGIATYTTTSQFRNSGRVDLAMTGGATYMGAQGTNYALQSVNTFKQESTTATRTGFIANRVTAGAGGQIAMRGVSADYTDIVSTGNLIIAAGWNGNFNSGSSPLANSILINAGSGHVGLNVAAAGTNPASRLTVYDGDTEMTGSANGVILESPDGTRYRATMLDGGAWDINAA